MTTPQEAERIKRERDDVVMLKNPDLWPRWPLCPVKRYDKSKPHGFPDCGVVTEGRFVVFMVNLYRVSPGVFDSCEKHEYESYEDMVADGWMVD